MQNNITNGDLKFIRSMMERTQRQIDPASPIMITWGLICLFGYPASHWLAMRGQHIQINRLWWALWLLGGLLSMFFGCRMKKREMNRGIRSYISRQIAWVWAILVVNGVVWMKSGILRDLFGGPGFIWAALYGIGISMMGILYSKEWLVAGIGIFIMILVAAVVKPYAYIILGAAMGLGCIIPALIAQRRMRRWEREDVAE